MRLPSALDSFSDSVLGDPIAFAQCAQIPGSDTLFRDVGANFWRDRGARNVGVSLVETGGARNTGVPRTKVFTMYWTFIA